MLDICPDPNDTSKLNDKEIILGEQLVEAFHHKDKPELIKQLVQGGAPVNYRLSYGLEVKLEADFVAAFRLMLEGDQDEKRLLDNAKKLVGEEDSLHLANYVKTAQVIFEALYAADANHKVVPVNPKFIEHLKQHPTEFRADPDQKNGSLIIAAGLRDTQLIDALMKIGQQKQFTQFRTNLNDKDAGYKYTVANIPRKGSNIKQLSRSSFFSNANSKSELDLSKLDVTSRSSIDSSPSGSDFNGAAVNFRGYFGDSAAVWSSILLDIKGLEKLLRYPHVKTNKLGISESTLLHWAVLAARLDEKDLERQERANMLVDRLLQHGVKPDEVNRLNKSAVDYARGKLKEKLITAIEARKNPISRHCSSPTLNGSDFS